MGRGGGPARVWDFLWHGEGFWKDSYCPTLFIQTSTALGKGPKKKCKNVVFDRTPLTPPPPPWSTFEVPLLRIFLTIFSRKKLDI